MTGDPEPTEEPAAAVHEEVETLEGVTSGRWIVTTEHGTRHLLDLGTGFAFRVPGPGRADWGRHPLTIIRMRTAMVGKEMLIRNFEQWRTTTTVVSIRRCSDEEWERIVAEELT